MKRLILLLLISSSAWAQEPAKKTKYSINEFMLIEKVEDQEKKYNEVLNEPAENLAKTALNDFRAELAVWWLSKGNVDRYKYYMATNPKFSGRQTLNLSIAVEKLFDEKKDYANAAQISRELLDNLSKGSMDPVLVDIIPHVLLEVNAASNAKLGNIDVAKKMIAQSSAHKSSKNRLIRYFKDAQANYLNRAAIVMLAGGEPKNAFDTLETAFKDAESNLFMVGTFKEAFKKVKGTDKGFESYLKSLQSEAYQKCYKEVEKHYVESPSKTITGTFPDPNGSSKLVTSFEAKKPIENVSMKNLAGNTVNLGNYKGKILVLDFWTTGCTPCVSAFAGFEKVVADFKKDKLQLFVVNVFEDNATVKAFAAHKHITLDVLRDEENKEYNVAASPSKIIYDPMGNIRFFSTGYAGSTDREYYKLKAMVEITKARASSKLLSKSK
jgi:peroxiredoxin